MQPEMLEGWLIAACASAMPSATPDPASATPDPASWDRAHMGASPASPKPQVALELGVVRSPAVLLLASSAPRSMMLPTQALVRVDHAVDPHIPIIVLAMVGRRLERQ